MPSLISTQFLKPVSFGSFLLQQAPFLSMFLAEAMVEATPEIQTKISQVTNNWPVDVGRQPIERTIALHIKIKGCRGYTPERAMAYIDTLYTAFDLLANEPQYLEVSAPGGPNRRLLCRVEQVSPVGDLIGLYVVRLVAADAPWVQVREKTDSQLAKSTSPISYNITVVGNTRCYPTFEITPTASKNHDNGYKRRWRVVLANKVSRTVMDTLGAGYPIDVVNNGLDTAAEIAAGRLLGTGYDLRLFVDGRNITSHVGDDRWLQDLNTASAQVWGNITLAPKKIATPKADMTAISPANGESIAVGNPGGLVDWPESGFFVIDDEVIYYASRTDTSFDGITRAVWGTTAAIHTTTDICYWVEHDIQIEFDYTAAVSPPASTDLQPLISLASTNAKHLWADGLIAPGTRRSGQWLSTYSEDDELSPYLSLKSTGDEFKDAVAAGSYDQKNNLNLYAPFGVDSAADTIENDITVHPELAMLIFGADEYGKEALIVAYDESNDGADKKTTGGVNLTRLRYNVRRRSACGSNPYDGSMDIGDIDVSEGISGYPMTSFVLTKRTKITGIAVRVKKAGTPDADLTLRIYTSIPPSATYDPDQLTEVDIPIASIGGAFAVVAAPLAANMQPTLDPGTYMLRASGGWVDSSNHYLWSQTDVKVYQGNHWEWDTSASPDVWSQADQLNLWFRLFGYEYTAEDDLPIGSSGTIALDNTELTWDMPPYIAVLPKEEIYSYDAVLENETTGQSIVIHFISALSEPLTINCETKQVTGGELRLSVPYALDFSDEVDWMYFVPGVNVIRYIESGIGTLGIVTTHQGRYN